MQTQSDWPPVTDDILRPSPFAHPVLHTLHCVARVLLFPTYWALDQLIGCWAPTARPSRLRAAAGGGVALLLLLLFGLPLALPGLLLWLPLQACRRPFCYQPPPPCWVPPTPWRPCAEFARCFVFLTANLCLLPDGLARFSNLPHSQRRAKAIGATLLNGLRPSLYGATGCSPQRPGEPGGTLTAQMPAGLDFVCLQEVQLGILDGHRIVGFLHCTHLHAPTEDGLLRCKQLTLLLDWAEQFEAESRQSGEAVAFSVLLGDLNFDNCSKDHAQEQGHKLFRCFRDPCRLSTRQDQPWALGTILSTSTLHQSVASSPEMLRRALEQEKGRHLYLAGPPRGGRRANPWLGRRLDYITYREMPGSVLIPEVEQVMFSTALAGLTDHLTVGLQLRVSALS
ncbi:sphingomyelin phosphodiesterase 5 isoform X2 [Urocitellus parryii]